jgi:hypothetical protein
MAKKLTKKQLQDYVARSGVKFHVNDTGNCIVVFSADKDFGFDVVVIFDARDSGSIQVTGVSPDFDKANGDAANLIALCNRWNSEKLVPKAYYDVADKHTVAECSFFLDEEVSDGYIIENCIKVPVSGAWQFFCWLVKD